MKMKKYIYAVMFCVMASSVMAQKPHYLPGDGIYIVGLPADGSATYDCPVMVTEAYQAKFKTSGAELASISAGKSYNISNRLQEDGTLDLVSFMGCGQATNLIVRNYDGESYAIGDYAPNKTWKTSYLVAAFAPWDGKEVFTLGVYDHWDCPVSYAPDAMLTERGAKSVTVDFGNPHEGLVVSNINFNLVTASSELKSKSSALKVKLSIWNEERTNIVSTEQIQLGSQNLFKVKTTDDGKSVYSVYVDFGWPVIIDKPFTVEVEGFDKLGVEAWIPLAVDTHALYPTHTTYHLTTGDEQVASTDACINVDGYFNYVGTWSWPDGKCEYGECVAAGDYVQVYIDPSDPDWPGMYFTGDPTFPVECAFGANDLMLSERPEWINSVDIDQSQWQEYGALLIIMQADAIPTGETGRYGKVVISTKDEASHYTIHVRQGNGSFPASVDGVKVELPADGGMFDLSGRKITAPRSGQLYIKNGKKIIK